VAILNAQKNKLGPVQARSLVDFDEPLDFEKDLATHAGLLHKSTFNPIKILPAV